MQINMKYGAAASVLFTLLSGCANLAPDYQQPAAPVAASFDNQQGYSSAAINQQEVQLNTPDQWRQIFIDPQLQRVIAQSLENNRDWRIAMLNVSKARAQYQISDAERWPSVDANGSGSNQRIPTSSSGAADSSIARSYGANVGITSFELDFFGRVKNLSAAALSEYMATTEAQRSARLSLIANVANGWYSLAAEQEKLIVATATLSSRQESLALIERRLQVGVAGELDLREAQTLMDSAAVDVARFHSQVQQARNALQLLVGASVAVASLPAGWQEHAVPGVPALPANLASSVLLQRPDVLQAEQQLRASNANIGAARAAFFPRITLTANAGTVSAELGNLFQAGSGAWLFMPQINLPIFDGGRNQANLDIAKVERDLAVATYEKAIQSGFREVADGLVQIDADRAQLQAQARVLKSSQQALSIADARFQTGVAGFLELLIAKRSYYAAQLVMIHLQQAQAANQIGLYKALALY